MNKMIKNYFLSGLIVFVMVFASSCTGPKQVELKTDDVTIDSSMINDPKVVYYSGVMSQKLITDDAFYIMDNLMRDPMPNDESWKFQLNVQLMRLQRILTDQYGFICPVEFEDANIHDLKALESCRFVLENYPKALENSDTELMSACSAQMIAGAELIGIAAEELNKQQP